MPRRKQHQTLEDFFPVVPRPDSASCEPSCGETRRWRWKKRRPAWLAAARPPNHSQSCPHCLLATFANVLKRSVRRGKDVKTTQERLRRDIGQIRKATEALERLRRHWISLAYAGPRTDPHTLRSAAAEWEQARRRMLPSKKPLFDTALADLVALVWVRTGSPRHELVAAHVARLPSFNGYSLKAHEDWVRRHRALIEQRREWVHKHFLPAPR